MDKWIGRKSQSGKSIRIKQPETLVPCLFQDIRVYPGMSHWRYKTICKIMYNPRIWTHDLMHNTDALHLLVGVGRAAHRRRVRGPQRPRAGDDVTGMGLPRHLDSPGPDSEDLTRVPASASRRHAGDKQFWCGQDWQCNPVEKRLQAAAGQLAGRSAVKGVTPGRPLELELALWPSVLAVRPGASAIRAPSQTAGLVSTSHKTRFHAIAKHNKTICVGRILN